LNLILIPISF